MATIGIDFGTTNSVLAIWNTAGSQLVEIDDLPIKWAPYGFDGVFPTVMAKDENNRLTFGWEAKTKGVGTFNAVKRLFATQSDVALNNEGDAIDVEEVATMLFAEMRRRALTSGAVVDRAVITVPANSKGRARHRTKVCAGMAGFEVLALINEPTAAAMAYAQKHPEARRMMVFDWGGGTLDVTILRSVDGVFIEETSSGLPRSGGLDFDARLRKIVEESVPGLEALTPTERELLRNEIELAKIRLSTAEETSVELPGGKSLRVTRARFEQEVMPLIEESRIPIERCLKELGVGAGSFDALVLVGGTCRIPAVRTFVKNLVGIEPDPSFNPMTAVGEGAAIAAAILSGELDTSDFFVSTEHALGTWILDGPNEDGLNFSTLIPKGHKLPAKASSPYYPVFRETESVNVQVVEGDPDAVGVNQDFVILKEWDVPLVKDYSEDSLRAFTLQFEYDVDGILHVLAIDNDTGTVLLDDDVSYGIATDKRELKKVADRARQAVETGTMSSEASVELMDPEAVKLLSQARNKVIPFLDDDEGGEIIALADALEKAGELEVATARDALRRALAPHSYLF
jgi:molecular chaperone DnaK (HSP70)